MQVYTVSLPERKSSKSSVAEWVPCADDFGPKAGQLTIHTDRATCVYTVSEFPTGWDGRGFQLVKLTPGTDKTEEAYSVFCARNGQDRMCECKGFQFKGHCKHVDAIRELIGNGWL